jgi:hypothetical protein
LVDPAQERFHWLAADGARLSGSEQELRAALSSGALAPTTLVWRKGWLDWLAANHVAELHDSIPAAARSTVHEPQRDPRATNPPALRMPGIAPRPVVAGPSARPSSGSLRAPVLHAPLLSNRPTKPGLQETARDTLAPSSFGNLGPGAKRNPPPKPVRRESGPPPPPQRARSPMPTLGEEQGTVSATATLRPPGAVPPPARGAPVPAFDSSPRAASAIMTPIPAFGPVGGKVDTPRPASLPPVQDKAPLAASAAAEPAPAALAAALDSTLEVAPEIPVEARRTPVPAAVPARRAPQDSLVRIGRLGVDSRTVVMALSALSGALLVAVVGLLFSRSSDPPRDTEPHPSSSTVSPALAAPVAVGCTVALPAARIAPSIERSVPPYAARIESDGALALGIASSKTKGIGMRLDPRTLDVSPAFEEESKDAVRGVVPLTRSGSLTFFVDRDDKALRSAHTIDEAPPFTLGVSDAGFSRVVAGSTSVEWPLAPDAKITEPRTAALGDAGYGITFRRGGQSGSVLLGFVGRDGAKHGELAEIPGAPKFLGTPVIAGSAAGVLVAFAGRDASDAPWKLFVSRTTPGSAPSAARALIAGSGGGAISPALSALGGGRWLAQWTEGSSGQYHVHVQAFSGELEPLGQNVLVSPKGANAGQGALASFGDGAATLFILTTAGHDELWGATLSCR